MNVEKYQTLKCQNDECGQEFNQENVKLAVLLYGVILLKQNETQDDKECRGYIGLKCPKCLNNSLFRTSAQAVQDFKNHLQSGSTLKYYSPFYHKDLYNMEGFDIEGFTFQEPEDEPYFSDELLIHTVEDNHMLSLNLPSRFCSYVWDRDDRPAGYSTWVCWFQEDEIETLSGIEKMNELQTFPRYYHMSDLVRKIDSLLKYNYFYGEQIDQAKSKWDKSIKENPQKIKVHWPEKAYERGLEPFIEKLDPDHYIYHENPVEKQINKIAYDPKLTGLFMEVLIAEPCPLKDAFGSPQKNCDYLWAVTDPFYQKEFPSESVPEMDIIENQKKEGFDTEIIDFVKKHFTKQYAQDYLVEDLEDFLEEYQELILSNRFSYARVWNLKQSYLKGLKKAIIRGLSDEALYVMKKEGKAWKMVFNGKEMNGLTKIGFTYLYHLICKTNDDLSHVDLFVAAGKANVVVADHKGNYDETDNVEKNKPTVIQLIDKEGVQKVTDRIKKLKNEIDDAKEFGNMEKVHRLKEELDDTKKFFRKVYDKNKKRPRFLKDENTKKIIDSVANAIKRALDEIKKEDPDAYQHFSKALGINNLYQNSIAYRPAPNEYFDWITIG